MILKLNIDERHPKEKNILIVYNKAQKNCDEIFIDKLKNSELANFKYNINEVTSELGVDEELVSQLIEDYITQIFKASSTFQYIIDNLKCLSGIDKESKIIELKNFSHKNLGVAKNLRIKDAQLLLQTIMNEFSNISLIEDCANTLESCAYKLNPRYAYNVMQLESFKSKI